MVKSLPHIIVSMAVFFATVHAYAGEGETQGERRVLSLDYCADQYALALLDKKQIIALSPEADSHYAYYKERAKGLPKQNVRAEAVLLSKPDIVLRLWGGGFNAQHMLGQLNIDVVQVGFGHRFADVRDNLMAMGQALGRVEQSKALIQDFDQRYLYLERMRPSQDKQPLALYITPGGVSAGSETFVHEIMTLAGIRNAMAEAGHQYWPQLDLEALVQNPPELIVAGFFDLGADQPSHWSIARHRVLQRLMRDIPVVYVPSRYLACSAWFALDAAELIHNSVHGQILAEGGHITLQGASK